jgi:hypothetical protein
LFFSLGQIWQLGYHYQFDIGAPEEINLGTGIRPSYCFDVLLSGSLLTKVKDAFRHIPAVHEWPVSTRKDIGEADYETDFLAWSPGFARWLFHLSWQSKPQKYTT